MLKGNQHKIDKNKNNKIDAHDFKLLRKEDAEQVEEGWDDMLKSVKDKQGPQPSGGSGVKQGTRYGGGRQKDAPEHEETPAKPKAKRKFSEMVDVYKESGIKGLFEELKVVEEEASQEEFTKEVEKQKKKAAGTASEEEKAEVAKPAVQAVQQEEVEQVEERALTDVEMEKREENVKSMKKNLQGFKDRYGKDAKSVMYATATKQAKGE